MRRFVIAVLLGVLATQAVAAALAAKTVVQSSPSKTAVLTASGGKRTRVVVHRSFPIRRTWPVVVVRPTRVAIVRPAVFIAPVLWRPVVVGVPSYKQVVWARSETLRRAESWTEFTVPCGRRGDSMFMMIDGKAQFEFAEIVFGNGEVYSLGTRLLFGDGSTSREIDLPGDARHIERVEFRYGNLPGGGRAQAELWAQ